MLGKKKKQVFGKKVRIREKELIWLKKNKDTKTIAGYLDKLINYYRTNVHRKQKVDDRKETRV